MSRSQKTHLSLNAVDVSRSSTSTLDPALSMLSPQDAEVLDAIIARASDATAFMAVFKAYSEVLQQRGLDPGNDIVYYKQLLKLGVVKGANWGTKWSIVKSQLGLDLSDTTTQRPSGKLLPANLTGLTHSHHEEDVFTLHSHAEETETAVDPPQRTTLPFGRLFKPELSPKTNAMESLDLNSEQSMSSTQPLTSFPVRRFPMLHGRPAPSSFSAPDDMDEAPIRSSTPPLPRFHRNQTSSPAVRIKNESRNPGEQRPSRINDVEAWKKIGLARQLQDADHFRRETLLSMCFQTWKGGLDWICTTHTQIVNARNHIQLQIHFMRWKEQAVRLKHIAERATKVARLRTQSAILGIWKEQARRRRIAEWRDDMRSRMNHFKCKGEERIRNDAWTRWRQLYLSRQLYARNILLRTFCRWRVSLRRVDTLESMAEGIEDAQERRMLENAMELWSRRIQMRDAEKYLLNRVSRRTLGIAFETWIRNLRDNHRADVHQIAGLLKRVFVVWRKAKAHKRVLNSRGDKYVKRRNDLLLRAIVRVWVARERGKLLDRVRDARLLKETCLVLHQRLQEQRLLQDRATTYYQHASGLLLASIFDTWVRRRSLLHNSFLLAEQHHITSLLYRTLLVWRLRLRLRLKQSRKAKMARKYFVERNVWDKWRLVMEKNKKNRIVQAVELARLRRVFLSWLVAARCKRRQDQVIKACQKRTRRRLLRTAVQHWTNRVVFLKLREIDTAEQNDGDMMSVAFTKWKDMGLRHVENLSLVNSFQDVKREDTLRRILVKWLTAARKSRTRRTRLAEHEHELRLETLAAAWEIWRERFRENGLRDLEYQSIIQSQSNLLYRAFIIWQSRSKSVPGIRLHATNLKIKVWDMWRAAMPLAVQARRARELSSKTTLSTMFVRWKEAHRTKMALKAVARARYLRLPSPGYKSSAAAQLAQNAPLLRPLLHRPLRSQFSAATDDDPGASKDHAPVSTGPVPNTHRRGLSSLLASRPASRAATTEGSNPRVVAPSSAGGDDRRDRLWNELRGARIHELPRTNRAKSR